MTGFLAQATEPIRTPSIDWLAIAPYIALFGAAIVIVLGKALLRGRSWLQEGALLVACLGVLTSGVFVFVQWHIVDRDGPYQAIAGMVAVDGFAVFVMTVILLSTLLALFLAAGYLEREQLEGPEYYALMLCSATGMMLMASANDLIIVFLALGDPLDRAVRARRVRPQAPHVARSGPEVLPPGLVLLRDLPLRRRARVRRDGQHEPHQDRRLPRDHHAPRRRRAVARHRAHARRSRVQGRGGAVPHVDARRVPRRADSRDRVHGRRDEGGRVRRDVAGAARRVRPVPRRLAPGDLGPRRPVAVRRLHRRARADRRETDARLLVDQSRGLHPDRRAGRDRGKERAPRSST